jgi:Flavodoxin
MKAVVIYESMYGNTHLVANAIADGLRETAEAVAVSVYDANRSLLADADLIVVGGPTHVHGMSRVSTRHAAVEAARKPESELNLDPDAEGPGLREWFDALGPLTVRAAAFDTRIDAPPALTGRASKGIARRLRRHGCRLITDPESFLVTKDSRLEGDEQPRAREWGAHLAAIMTSARHAAANPTTA